MVSSKRLILTCVGLLAFLPAALYADYTLVLKNGRRITVPSYREEGGMVKFPGFGGEVGIGRDQIQSILKAGEPETQGMSLPGAEKGGAAPAAVGQEEKAKAGPEQLKADGKEKALSPEEKQAQERAKEEQAYQDKVRQLTEQIKATRDRYALATRGTAGPEPTLLNTPEAIKARTDDLNSRLRDSQYNPAGPSDAGSIKLQTPSPFSGQPSTTTELRPGQLTPRVEPPLPEYTTKEKELSDLRNQLNQLQKQRDGLIEEMKQKNFDTGGLFLE